MSAPLSPKTVLADGQWLAHRYVEDRDAVQFLKLTRDDHIGSTFITDEYLPTGRDRVQFGRAEALAAMARPPAPLHFVFHSAFCCSTLIARAFEWPGRTMALKEPVILNDVVGFRRRGAPPPRVAAALDAALTLLARPIETQETVIVKPSNIINGLASAVMAMRPNAKALLLHAPLETYVTSVAKKGLDGRLWVRQLFFGLRRDGLVQDLGFDDEALFAQTDLQIAALGWLAQHRVFLRMAQSLGPARIRTLDSETLLDAPPAAMSALCTHFGLNASEDETRSRGGESVFGRNSKTGQRYGREQRLAEYAETAGAHGDEVKKVVLWANAVADAAEIPMTLPAPLIG